jgi:hypothetical protein
VRIAFNRERPPTLDDVYAAIEKTLAGDLRCTECGFDGVDYILALEDIVNPAGEVAFVATKKIGAVVVEVAG